MVSPLASTRSPLEPVSLMVRIAYLKIVRLLNFVYAEKYTPYKTRTNLPCNRLRTSVKLLLKLPECIGQAQSYHDWIGHSP